jgi:hypothetical protein
MGFRVSMLKGLRWAVWLFLAWVFLRGAVSIVAPPPPVGAQVPAPVAPAAEPPERETPGAFAALFAREYLTWEVGGEADRASRLAPFLARHIDAQAGWSAGPKAASQTAEFTLPFRLVQQSDNRWLVTVAARVSVKREGAAVSRTLYLAVPVAQTKEGYVVYDYPTLVPAPPRVGELDGPLLRGDEIPDPGDQVRTLLTSFFKAYAAGGGADVAYYLEPGLQVKGLEGALVFQRISELTLRQVQDQTWAAVLVTWEDPVTGTLLRQRYTLQLVERDGRRYIKEIVQKGA